MHHSTLAAALLCAALAASPVLAQEKRADKPAKPAQPTTAAPAAEKPVAEKPAAQPEQEMAEDPMAMMMELATPGAEHELMKQFEGNWHAKTTAWFGPEPTESTGMMRNSFVLDGRFLRHDFQSEMMGMPFKGLGYWGYDKAKKEWVGSWMDTWGTGIMTSSRGSYDAATKTWTMQGTYFNPETGQDEKQREIITVIDNDTHRMQMFMAGPDGKEMKSLEITYTRAKNEGRGRDGAPGQQRRDDRAPNPRPQNPNRR